MGKNSRTNWDTVLKANKVLKFLVMIEKFINIYTDSIDITCVLFKSLDAFGPWNLNLIETETKCLFQSIDWRENLHLPSSTIIYLYLRLKNMVSFKISLKQIQWLKAPTALQENPGSISLCSMGFARIAAWKKNATTCGHVGAVWGKFIITWSPLEWWSISLLLAMRSPQKRYLPRFLLRWNLVKPSILFLNVYIYICVCM